MRGQLPDPHRSGRSCGAGPDLQRLERGSGFGISPSTLNCLSSSLLEYSRHRCFRLPTAPDSQLRRMDRIGGAAVVRRLTGSVSGVVRGAYLRLSSAPAAAEPTRARNWQARTKLPIAAAGRNAMTAQVNLPLGNPMCDSTGQLALRIFRMDLILAVLPAASPIPQLPPRSPT